jgi:putative ABC transport system permease protein
MIPNKAQTHNRPLYRTAWRRVRRRPLQYILFIVGVMIGVAMMISISIASQSASRAFALSTNAITGKATHRLVADSTGLDEALYTQLRVQAGIAPAAPIVEGYVLAEQLGGQPMRLVGIDLFAEPPFRSYFGDGVGSQGDFAAFLAEPNTVVLSAPLAEQAGLNLGDTLTISLTGQETDLRVVGLLQPADDVNRRALGGILFTDIANAQQILGLLGRLSHIDLILPDETAVAQVEAQLPPGVLLQPAASQGNAIQQMTAAFELNLTALSMLALVVGMFLIYNTVSFSVVQRRPLFGVLRSLGVTGQQLLTLILVEAAVLSLIGSLLGLALGVLLGRGMVRLVTQTINDLFFVVNVQDVTIPPQSLLLGLALGVLAALAASLIPALEAMRTTPLTALRRSTLESKTRRLLPWMVLGWAVLLSIGLLLLRLPQSLILAFAGLFTILFAWALLTPPVTAVFMHLLAPIGQATIGVLGRMAPRDIVRSLSRTSVAIAALMVAVSVVVGVSIMIGSFRNTVTIWLGDTLQADIFISPPRITSTEIGGALAPDVLTGLTAVPGIAEVVTAREITVQLPDSGRLVQLIASSGDVSQGQRQYLWLAGDQAQLWADLAAGKGVMVSEPLLQKENLGLPPRPITLQTPQGERTFPVLAVYYDYASQQGAVHMNTALYEPLWGDTAVSTVGIFVQPTAVVDEVVADLQAQFNGRNDLIIQSNKSVRDGALEIFDRTFAITAALRLLAVVVAFIGVLSALMSLQLERTRELGVLRATGMTVRQVWALTLLETGLMGGLAGVLAWPTGFVLAWVLIYVINVRSFGWTLQMELDPVYFGQAFLVALGAALLAGIYPAYQMGRTVIATAIRQE